MDRGARLQEALDYNLFVKKADQMLSSVTKQLLAVNACVPAPTVEETKEAQQRLDTLDRLASKNNARFREIEAQAVVMINADHPDREGVEERMEDLQAMKERVEEALKVSLDIVITSTHQSPAFSIKPVLMCSHACSDPMSTTHPYPPM